VFVGWCWPILTGNAIELTAAPMKIGIAGELATAAFCLFLPHTPPVNKGRRRPPGVLSGSQTWDLFRQPRFMLLMTLAVLAHVPSQFYYAYCNPFLNNWIGWQYAAAKMSLGQVVEVVCMLLLPAVLLRVSIKTAILIGLATWSVRFWILSAVASPPFVGRDFLLYFAILMHGVAFTLVSISLQLDVDRCAGLRRRATAQGLLSVAMSGVGCFIGAGLAGAADARWLAREIGESGWTGWHVFWMAPAVISAGVFVLTALFLPRDGPVRG
jgi:predicted MFS family arabinose efflux permease